MRAFVLTATAAFGLAAAAASPAAAQFGIEVGPGGVYVNPGYDDDRPRYRDDFRISRREAIRIARRNGIEDVDDVDRSGPWWIVRGESYRGRRISVRVHAYDGRVR